MSSDDVTYLVGRMGEARAPPTWRIAVRLREVGMKMLTFYTAPWQCGRGHAGAAVCTNGHAGAAVYNAGDRGTVSVGQLTQIYRQRLLVSPWSQFSALEVLCREKKKIQEV